MTTRRYRSPVVGPRHGHAGNLRVCMVSLYICAIGLNPLVPFAFSAIQRQRARNAATRRTSILAAFVDKIDVLTVPVAVALQPVGDLNYRPRQPSVHDVAFVRVCYDTTKRHHVANRAIIAKHPTHLEPVMQGITTVSTSSPSSNRTSSFRVPQDDTDSCTTCNKHNARVKVSDAHSTADFGVVPRLFRSLIQSTLSCYQCAHLYG